MFQLFDDVQVFLLLFSGGYHVLFQLSNLLFLALQLPLAYLQIDLKDTLFAGHVLVHFVNLVQILFEVLSLLLELQVFFRY